MQRHLLATRPGRVRRKSRQDEIAAEQFVHHGHYVGMLHNLLEYLALVDQVEYALIRAFGFKKCNPALPFQLIQPVEVVADAPQENRRDKIRNDAYAALFDFAN